MFSRFRSLPVHLRAVSLALLSATLGMAGAVGGAIRLENQWTAKFPYQLSEVKNQGTVLQRAAFSEPGVLPLYGSSELIKNVPDKASLFFAQYPTDFAVSPIGRAGCTSLIMLQKIAAATTTTPGRKVAIILSPSWFLVPEAPPGYYAGNFSRSQASQMIWESPLSWSLKRDIARRLLSYPEPMAKTPLLRFAVDRLAKGEWADRALLVAARPLGWMQNAIFEMQDHCAAGRDILTEKHRKTIPRESAQLAWKQLLAEESQAVKKDADDKEDPRPHYYGTDLEFRRTLESSREWNDLDLLLRTLKELHLDPLLVTIPMELRHFEGYGISRTSVDVYARRIREVSEQYKIPIADFPDHEEDGKFFSDHHDHLSAKGWIYLDRALDDFYHSPSHHTHRRHAETSAAEATADETSG